MFDDAWEPFRQALIDAGGSVDGWSFDQKRRIIAAIGVCDGVPLRELEALAEAKRRQRIADAASGTTRQSQDRSAEPTKDVQDA